MTLDIWFKEDIRNLLRGQLTVIERLPECQWRAGYITALEAVAVQIGVELHPQSTTRRPHDPLQPDPPRLAA